MNKTPRTFLSLLIPAIVIIAAGAAASSAFPSSPARMPSPRCAPSASRSTASLPSPFPPRSPCCSQSACQTARATLRVEVSLTSSEGLRCALQPARAQPERRAMLSPAALQRTEAAGETDRRTWAAGRRRIGLCRHDPAPRLASGQGSDRRHPFRPRRFRRRLRAVFAG